MKMEKWCSKSNRFSGSTLILGFHILQSMIVIIPVLSNSSSPHQQRGCRALRNPALWQKCWAFWNPYSFQETGSSCRTEPQRTQRNREAPRVQRDYTGFSPINNKHMNTTRELNRAQYPSCHHHEHSFASTFARQDLPGTNGTSSDLALINPEFPQCLWITQGLGEKPEQEWNPQHLNTECLRCPSNKIGCFGKAYMHIYIHTYIHPYTHTCIHTYIHPYTHTYIHPYAHTYIHTSIHPYIHTYIHPYTHTYIHTYIHTPIHTYIHIHIHIYMWV